MNTAGEPLHQRNPTERFSSRVDAYAAARPSYPAEVVTILEQCGGLRRGQTIADIGSGTGKSCELFLAAGYAVIGVEPNAPMRARAEADLAHYANFRSVDGRAEATALDDASVDAIVACQAFHWFEPTATRAEFLRILRPGGLIALIWNDRARGGDRFHRDYEQMLRTHCPEYEKVASTWGDEIAIARFASPHTVMMKSCENAQTHDYESLMGRLLSSSYVPKEGPGFEAVQRESRRIFDENAVDGRVTMRYETKVFFGRW